MADDSSKQNDTANKTIYTDPDELTKVEAQTLIMVNGRWIEIGNSRTTNVLNQKISSVADQVNAQKAGIATATTDAQNAIDKADAAIDTATNANTALTNVQNDMVTVTTNLATVKDDLAASKIDLQTKIDSANDSITSVSSDLATTKLNLQSVSDEAVKNGNDIISTNDTVAGLQTDLASTTGDVTELKTTAKGLQADIVDAQGNITDLQSRAGNLESNLSDAQGNITTLQQSTTTLGASLKDVQGNITTLQSTASGLVETTSDNKNNIASLQTSVSGLETDVSSAQGDINNLQVTASGLKESLTSAQGDIATLQNTASTLSSEMSSKVDDTTYQSDKTQTATSFNESIAKVQNSVDTSAVGTNLLTGTSSEIKSGTVPAGRTDSGQEATNGFQYPVNAGETYTYQVYIGKDTPVDASTVIGSYDGSKNWYGLLGQGNTITAETGGVSKVTFTIPTGVSYINLTPMAFASQSSDIAVSWKEEKLEKGSVAHDWSANPADNATVTQFNNLSSTVDGLNVAVGKKVDETTYEADLALTNTALQARVTDDVYEAKMSELSNDINFRVKTADLLSQINVEAGNILIQSNKLYLDASSVVFGGTAYITDAMISNVTADKITAGTMNVENIAMKGSLATLDISGDNLTFKSNDTDGWSTTINQDGINFTGSYNSVQEFMGGLYLGYEQQDTRVNGFYTTIVTNQRMKDKISTAGGDETGINVPYLVNGNVTDDYKIIYNASGVGHSMGLHIYDDTYISHQDPLISGLSSEDSHIYADTVQTLHLAAQGNVALEPNTGFTMFSGTGYIHSDSYRNLIGTTGAQYTVFQNAKVSSTDTNHLGSVHLWELQYGVLTNTSRLSLKKNIELVNIDEMADKIYGIDVAAFNYKSQLDTAKKAIGPIVDDVNKTKKYNLPSEFISDSGNGTDDHSLIGALIATVQRQAKQISELELRMVNQELEG